MNQRYILILTLGLLIFAYVLDAVVNPLALPLATPYEYFAPKFLSLYPFTTISIVAKAVALSIASFWILSYIKWGNLTRGAVLFVLAGLLQLYALQDVATGSNVVPLEWSLAFTLTGIVLIIPALIYLLVGGAKKAYKSFSDEPYEPTEEQPPTS